MKNFLIFILCLTYFITKGSEVADTTKAWKVNGNTSLNFSQVSLTNWSEGGSGSVSGAFLFGVNANNKQDRHYWDNSFSLEYGMTKNDGESARKSVDQLYLSSKYGYEIGKPWYLSVLFDFRTQMAKGFNYPNDRNYISKLMAPGYMNFALGFDYKPKDNISLFISPVSTRFTYVMDDSLSTAGAFGVDPGRKFRAELGSYLKFQYIKKTLVKNVDFQTRIDLFSNYLKDPQNIVVNWDLKLDMKINKFLSAVFQTTLKYDNDIKYVDANRVTHGARTQLKQLLGVGLTYKF
jgi:hypothetical protein